jgi:hypothetical protein
MIILQQTRGVLSSGGFDPIAARYLKTIESAGATVSSTQGNAFSNFLKAGKSDGWFSQIGRLYLPIWGVAAPNAVDIITATSGTFSGVVTHGAGFIQGNGSTGRFAMNASPQGVGMVAGSSSTFALVKTAQNAFNSLGQSSPVGGKCNGLAYGTGVTQYTAGLLSGINVAGTFNGILIESEIATNSRYLRRRTTAGAASLATNTTNVTGSYASYNQSVMAGQSTINAFYGYSTSEIGAYGMGLALTTTQADAFTLALKTLWETCTGLTLP